MTTPPDPYATVEGESGGIVRFRIGFYDVAIDVPHLLVLLCIEAFCLWYLLDARAASTDVQNLLLIEPAAFLAFIFFFLILRDIVKIAGAPVAMEPRDRLARGKIIRVVGSMALLGMYVGAMDFIGFDLATALYVFGSLALLGERRVWVLAITPIVFAGVAVFAFKEVVSIPFPVLLSFGR